MKEKLQKIINHYGINDQLKYFQSEVFELNEAILSYENRSNLLKTVECLNKAMCRFTKTTYNDYYLDHISEELADVMVMLNQFAIYYNLDLKKINEIMRYKVNRQIERINNEK